MKPILLLLLLMFCLWLFDLNPALTIAAALIGITVIAGLQSAKHDWVDTIACIGFWCMILVFAGGLVGAVFASSLS